VRPRRKNSRSGYAFLSFDDHDVVDRIVNSRGQHHIHGFKCNVERARQPRQQYLAGMTYNNCYEEGILAPLAKLNDNLQIQAEEGEWRESVGHQVRSALPPRAHPISEQSVNNRLLALAGTLPGTFEGHTKKPYESGQFLSRPKSSRDSVNFHQSFSSPPNPWIQTPVGWQVPTLPLKMNTSLPSNMGCLPGPFSAPMSLACLPLSPPKEDCNNLMVSQERFLPAIQQRMDHYPAMIRNQESYPYKISTRPPNNHHSTSATSVTPAAMNGGVASPMSYEYRSYAQPYNFHI